jgi:hypothetical protein
MVSIIPNVVDFPSRAVVDIRMPNPNPENLPSLPWVWAGGYPQRILSPDSTLIAEVFEDPDSPARIAPAICKAVNTYYGFENESEDNASC